MLRHMLTGLVALALIGCSESPSNGPTPEKTNNQDKGVTDTKSPTDKGGGGDKGPGADSTVDAPGDTGKPLVGEGYKVGQISMNWTLTDVNGKAVNLWDYRGKVIYFESGSEW